MPFVLQVALSTSKSGMEGSPLLILTLHVFLCYAKRFWHIPTNFVSVETSPPELPPTGDPSAGASRPAPATLQGLPTLTYKASTRKRLSSDEERPHHPAVALVLSERCPPVCFPLLLPAPFSSCDIPSLPSLVFSTSHPLPKNTLFYCYPFFLPLFPACAIICPSALGWAGGQKGGMEVT